MNNNRCIFCSKRPARSPRETTCEECAPIHRICSAPIVELEAILAQTSDDAVLRAAWDFETSHSIRRPRALTMIERRRRELAKLHPAGGAR